MWILRGQILRGILRGQTLAEVKILVGFRLIFERPTGVRFQKE